MSMNATNAVLRRRGWALAYGITCHATFAVAVATMARELYTGMQGGLGRLSGPLAIAANLALVAQFPLLHSLLLSRRGRGLLGRLAPAGLGRRLGPTTFALVAALQIFLTFALWSPTHVVVSSPGAVGRTLLVLAFAGSWVFLGKALWDAGLGLQSGWIGWSAVWQDRDPRYPGLPTGGLFACCRQPIYLGFALVMWTSPSWTLDRLLLAAGWGLYCFVGPILKERRCIAIYGSEFESYSRRVPYFFPKLLP
jgi:protein-S-isoprenylcysteine O-methyltransferase Ste14